MKSSLSRRKIGRDTIRTSQDNERRSVRLETRLRRLRRLEKPLEHLFLLNGF